MARYIFDAQLYARLARHFIRRLRHAKAGQAIIAALDREILVTSTFSYDGVLGALFKPGPAVQRITDDELRRALGNPAESNGNRVTNFVIQDGEITLLQAA